MTRSPPRDKGATVRKNFIAGGGGELFGKFVVGECGAKKKTKTALVTPESSQNRGGQRKGAGCGGGLKNPEGGSVSELVGTRAKKKVSQTTTKKKQSTWIEGKRKIHLGGGTEHVKRKKIIKHHQRGKQKAKDKGRYGGELGELGPAFKQPQANKKTRKKNSQKRQRDTPCKL